MRKVLVLFGILNDSDVEWLGSVGEVLELSAGTIVIHENERVDSVFVLLDGKCKVTVEASGAGEVAFLFPGEVFGEMSFVDSRSPSASVATLQRSHVLAIPRAILSERLETDKSFAARFYQGLAIVLGSRLRSTVVQLGHSTGRLQAGVKVKEEEIDPAALERLSAAALRFDNLQRRLRLHV